MMSNTGFINVATWDSDHVASWLQGLDDSLGPYIKLFEESEVNGERLLLLSHWDLAKLGVTKLGHQELILEGIDLLSHLYHELESETLQSLVLQLECRSRSLQKEIVRYNEQANGEIWENSGPAQQKLPLSVLTHLASMIDVIKNMVSWFDRSPFCNLGEYVSRRRQFVRIGMDLVIAAQGDSVAQSQKTIQAKCEQLWGICDTMIQDSRDSLFIQPAGLELATLRKKPEEELGMHIQSSYSGTHVIGGIKPGSPADMCNKIEGGDEVVQVNYQTVLGWQLSKLVKVLKENQKEVILTVKKRPHHASLFGPSVNKRRNQQKLQQSTLPKALSKRNSRGMRGSARTNIMDFLDPPGPPGTATEPIPEPVKELGNHLTVDTENGHDENDNEDDEEEEEEQDNDNVFRSGSESPGYHTHMVQLPVFEETKQRRATVSGGSPVMQRPTLEISDFTARPKSYTITVSSPGSEGSSYPSIDLTSPSLEPLNLGSPSKQHRTHASEADIEKNKMKDDQFVSTVVITPPTDPPMTSPSKSHRSELKIHLNESPVRKRKAGGDSHVAGMTEEQGSPSLTRLTRIDSTKRAERAQQEHSGRHGSSSASSSTRSSPGQDELRPDSVAGSYTVNIVGGVPLKIPVNKDAAPSSQSPTSLLRKKNIKRMITGGNRRVSCKDLGVGECEGWLWKKKDHGGGIRTSKWSKRWFVLKKQHLYFYKDPETSQTAQGVIHLPGFQVSPANEIKTKKFAFKAHHSGTTFYLASERQDDMAKWMNKLGLAAIVYDMSKNSTTAGFARADHAIHNTIIENSGYYSESEDEGTNPATPTLSSRESSREDLADAKDELVAALEGLKRETVMLDGRNTANRRKSTLQRGATLQMENIEELEYGRKLSSLQRTLKAKEQELKEIDLLLQGGHEVSKEKLHAIAAKLQVDPGAMSNSVTSEEDDENGARASTA